MSSKLEYGINIQLDVAAGTELPLARVKAAVTHTLRTEQIATGAELSLVITDDAAVQALNRQFRAIDAPTDVLSFPADSLPLPAGEAEDAPYLGDLVLAWPYIQRQARAEGHTDSDELTLAVIHGTLHLLGYDHDTAEHQAVMWAVQAELLDALGVPISVPEFEFPDED